MTSSFASTPAGLPAIAIPQLRAIVRGRVIAPDDPDYDDARALKIGGVDRRPAAIVRVADARDVARVVTFAAEREIPLAIRSGGHGMAGHGVIDSGVVLDLSPMKTLDIDVANRAAWAEPGLTAGEVTDTAGALGLAVPFGDTGSVGIGGITLAGGIGYLVRQYGLTIDSLLAAEIVTADGELRRVDAETEPDLFWAIRGGAGNVGVVTRFRYRLHPVEQVTGGMLILPATPETIAGFVAAAADAPEALSAIANVMPAPPMPFIPAARHGEPILMATLVHVGGGDAGERAMAPFRALASPIVDRVGPTRYPEVFAGPEPAGPPPAAAFRTHFVDAIDRDAAATILDALDASTATMVVAQLRVLGGAMARVPAEATAFAHRDAPMLANLAAIHGPADPGPHRAWVAALAAELRPRPGAYAGFLGDEGEARTRAAFPEATRARLADIKARFDPDNIFRANHNVPPAPAEPEDASSAA